MKLTVLGNMTQKQAVVVLILGLCILKLAAFQLLAHLEIALLTQGVIAAEGVGYVLAHPYLVILHLVLDKLWVGVDPECWL